MHILHIITGLADGGAEAVLYRLCTHNQDNHHTVISLIDEGKYGPLLSQAGIAVHCLRMQRGRICISGMFQAWRLIKHLKPDIVQTWMYHANLLGGFIARLAGVKPVVWGIHHSTLDTSKKSTIIIAKISARLSKWLPIKIVVCATKAAEIHIRQGYDRRKINVIPNGYNISQFHPNLVAGKALREEWGITGQTPIIGLVARFNPQKDHGNLLAALCILVAKRIEFLCVLVGRDIRDDNKELTLLIKKIGNEERVRTLGKREDIPAVMNAIDINVLSSSNGEAFPNVLAEAMSCGTPCVTTDVGDAATIVGTTGWVVPPQNALELADALELALMDLQDSQGWEARKHACRVRIAENFTIEKMVSAYKKVWQEAIIGINCPPPTASLNSEKSR